jgi:hypothetical protein
VEVIERNDTGTVEFLRAALGASSRQAQAEHQAVRDAIESLDSGCWAVLSSETRPVVVDASNVAHSLQAADGRPRLRNVLLVAAELRRCGWFPIYIIADAALWHQIDRQTQLKELVDSGRVELAEPRTDADELILERARALGCGVVTRDLMADHNADGAVPRIGYSVGHDSAQVFEVGG